MKVTILAAAASVVPSVATMITGTCALAKVGANEFRCYSTQGAPAAQTCFPTPEAAKLAAEPTQ